MKEYFLHVLHLGCQALEILDLLSVFLVANIGHLSKFGHSL